MVFWHNGWFSVQFQCYASVPDGFWDQVNAAENTSRKDGDESPVATKTSGTEYIPNISTVDIGGTTINITEDETLSRMMEDIHRLFISEITTRYSIDISNLPIATQFYRGSIHGDVWIVSTADKENKYEALIEYETDRIIEMSKKQQ